MWYFTWVLGLGLAVAFGILNGLWREMSLAEGPDASGSALDPRGGPDGGPADACAGEAERLRA